MKGKLKFILPLVALIVLGGAYKTVLAKPAPKSPSPRSTAQVYVLPKEFLLNLADDRYAKLTVALVLKHGEPIAAAEGGHARRAARGLGHAAPGGASSAASSPTR